MPSAQSSNTSNSDPATSRAPETALVSNTTSRNVARDTAIQINGHIANEIHYWNIETMFCNSYPHFASRKCTHKVWPPGKPSVEPIARLKPTLSTADKTLSLKNPGRPEQSAKRGQKLTLAKLELPYLALLSSLNGEQDAVCVIFRAYCRINYISKRIIRRFSLRTYVDDSADTSTVIAGRDKITPTQNYVTLFTPSGADSGQKLCRFYVVEYCLERFDVLIGSEIITNLSSSSSSARQDEPTGSIRPIRPKT